MKILKGRKSRELGPLKMSITLGKKTILLFSFSTRKARSFDKDIAEVEYAFTRIPFENGFSACK
jgi:hypothetical protein